MRLLDLVETSASVAGVSGRLEKIARLAALVERLEPAEVEIAIAFLSGATRQGRLGVGHAAIAASADVAGAAEATLTLADIDRTFQVLADVEGRGSSSARLEQLRALFRRATPGEQDFLRRLLYGELRQGALAGVLLEAVAKAAKVKAAVLRRAAMMSGSLGAAAAAALSGGESALHAFDVQLMRPVQPMLAESAETVDEALAALGAAAFEYKLDGARVQIHKAGDDVRMFSRTLRDVTIAAPEVVELVRALPARSIILDGEVIALKPDGRPQPFQITMSRFGRTVNVEQSRRDVPLTPFVFDCLYVDGTVMLDEPHVRRIGTLHEIAGSLAVPSVARPAADEAAAFTREALARGHEGVMAKALDAPYAAGRRGAAWLKIKQARTLDLVVLAVEWGHGRRRGWLSNLHLGARDPETKSFVMLGKTFKGMTDEMLAWQTEKLLTLEISRDAYTVYVRPELVVEVAFNEIQQSPVYAGGLALRFARVKRYRTDKTAAETDTIATVRGLA